MLDVVGHVVRLFLGVVSSTRAHQGGSTAHRPACGAGGRAFLEIAKWIGLSLPSSRTPWACCACSGLFTRAAAIVSNLLMVAFIIGISQAWARGLTIDWAASAAVGRSVQETRYPQEIARDAFFALAGAWRWWCPRSLASLDRDLFGH